MKVQLQYGTDWIGVEIPSENVTLLNPEHNEGLADEAAAFRAAAAQPIGSPPLRELVKPGERVAVVIPDITRALPTDRLLPWLFAELAHVPVENFTIITGTGSHRVNTETELAAMVGRETLGRYRVINHNSHDPATMAVAGRSPDGLPVLMNREYLHADRRIVLGFIEPHFMAGFSGGYKAVFPGVADLNAIMRYHNAATIGDPHSTWGVMDGNPTQALIRACGSLAPIDFCLNVTLNRDRRITQFFCGNVRAAHDAGCVYAKKTAMVACKRPFPIVVTSNSGFPLDQNLYQSVKGMSAAAQIIEPGGLILIAAECREGFPEHGNFKRLLFEYDSMEAYLEAIAKPGFAVADQWQVQLLYLIQLKARVAVHCAMRDEDLEAVRLKPVRDIASLIKQELERIGLDAPIAVLPEGPMTIPYLED